MINISSRPTSQGEITISHGFDPGDIGEIVSLHGQYYGRVWGLNESFEAQIAQGLGDFALLLMDAKNQSKNRQWIAKKDGIVVGAIAIQQDSQDESPESVARLRRFIVAEEVRGAGLGNRLMDEAMTFCRQVGYGSVFLWTYLGLDQARHLYEKNGFVLVEEKLKTDWGRPVTYVKFKCPLQGPRFLIKKAMPEDEEKAWTLVDEYCQSIGVQHRDSRQEFAKYFDTNAGVWLAQVDQEVVGCILLRPLDHIATACEVKRLCVKPQYRGLCVADAMLHALHTEAKALGYQRCYLDTRDDLKAAIRFYQRHGYRPCERYNDNEQATVFMSRALT